MNNCAVFVGSNRKTRIRIAKYVHQKFKGELEKYGYIGKFFENGHPAGLKDLYIRTERRLHPYLSLDIYNVGNILFELFKGKEFDQLEEYFEASKADKLKVRTKKGKCELLHITIVEYFLDRRCDGK